MTKLRQCNQGRVEIYIYIFIYMTQSHWKNSSLLLILISGSVPAHLTSLLNSFLKIVEYFFFNAKTVFFFFSKALAELAYPPPSEPQDAVAPRSNPSTGEIQLHHLTWAGKGVSWINREGSAGRREECQRYRLAFSSPPTALEQRGCTADCWPHIYTPTGPCLHIHAHFSGVHVTPRHFDRHG